MLRFRMLLAFVLAISVAPPLVVGTLGILADDAVAKMFRVAMSPDTHQLCFILGQALLMLAALGALGVYWIVRDRVAGVLIARVFGYSVAAAGIGLVVRTHIVGLAAIDFAKGVTLVVLSHLAMPRLTGSGDASGGLVRKFV